MTSELIFSNAKLVLPETVILGTLVIRDGVISDIQPGADAPKGAIDCAGDYLSPGLIELHTDNLERHLAPRPKVDWPRLAAILGHDRELAGAGITTVFDAIRVGSITSSQNKRLGRYAREISNDLLETQSSGALKISHHIHLRAEVCSETLLEELDEFGPDDKVGIVSLMDHTPGQRQFRDLEKFELYVRGKHNMPKEGFAEYMALLYDLQAKYGVDHEAGVVAAAKRYGATLASHDDTTADQVKTSHGHGVSLAEFPTTREAAKAGHAFGIANIMGSPNLVRGGSHSGNVAARELAEQGLLDVLSSDYVPASLLQGAVILSDLWQDMARAIATVTTTPARQVGLTDRGEIALGKRADLLRFGVIEKTPLVQSVWVQGQRVS